MTEPPKAPFTNAVEFDEWMSKLPPGGLKPASPRVAAFQDQARKAQADSVAGTEAALGKAARWVDHLRVPEWVRLGILDTLLKFYNGEAGTCVHMPNFQRPEPVFAAAWKPGVVTCGMCTHLFAVTGTDADAICDGCGHKCKGLPDDGIAPVAAYIGPLCYQVGVCMTCHAEWTALEKDTTEYPTMKHQEGEQK